MKRPYWEVFEGWDTAGNCRKCGEAGRCKCPHPRKGHVYESVVKALSDAFKLHQ